MQKFFDEKRRVQGEMSSIVEDIRHESKEDAIEKLGERTKVNSRSSLVLIGLLW